MTELSQLCEIDGIVLYRMFRNGYMNLKRNMSVIDALNVFPVPDGDTGKNMTMTLSGGVKDTPDQESNLGVMLKTFSRGTLMSARGNSGVITSQIIKGMATVAKEKTSINVGDFNDLLDGAVARAYKTVGEPVEGTILTVIKDAAVGSRTRNQADATFVDCLTVTLEEMRTSLSRTPELLPVLKEAGVVDSGGAGLICFFEGMLMELKGETLTEEASASIEYEDFQIQVEYTETEHVKYALVAVANGSGIIEYFKNAGVSAVIDGGQTNNPSAEAFIKAFSRLNADHILVLPGNSNIILTAEQAAKMYDKASVHVVPTKSIAETYSAISMFNEDLETVEEVLEDMEYYFSKVITGYVTHATRDTHMDGVEITEGHYIGLTNHQIYADSEKLFDATLGLVKALPEMEDVEVINFFFGKDTDLDTAMEIGEAIMEEYPMVEVNYVDGGQEVYTFIIAFE